MTKQWPTLYKFAKSGAVQTWLIIAKDYPSGSAMYESRFGQKNGKIQFALVEVKSGKNIGKANETTPFKQACMEAKAKWKKQLDKGYTEGAPKVLKRTDPMLAKKYQDCAHLVTFPCHWQPKLDGIRCVGFREDGKVKLVSRRGKTFNTLMHIENILEGILGSDDIFDGELYVHGIPFQTVISWIKRLQTDTARVKYNVYDSISDKPFKKRFANVCKLIDKNGYGFVRTVYTAQLNSDAEIKSTLVAQEDRGFEGIMLRVGDCLYENGRRSSNLLKCKSFQDEDFIIIGGEENKGRQKGQCTFVCKTAEGTTFKVKPKGTDTERKEYWENLDSYIGKELTVRFFEWTTSDKPVPRFPIGIIIRDYE